MITVDTDGLLVGSHNYSLLLIAVVALECVLFSTDQAVSLPPKGVFAGGSQ
jgi:hypothetical protein